ncbi:MAG: flippase [Candidatus Brocadiaceae bacterium]|nr:flippase [Candidatus Brocadiaceae bacterium]
MKLRDSLFRNISTKQIIIKNTFWLFLAEGVNKGLMFLLTILIARYLGAEGYGRFSFAFSFVSLFAVFADFGLSTLTIREVARDNSLAKKYIDNITVMKVFLGVITFGLITVVVQLLGKSSDVKWLVYLFGVYVVINSFNEFLRAVFRAFEKMQYEAFSKIVQGLVLFVIGVVFILRGYSVFWIIGNYIVGSGLSFLFTLVLVHKKFSKFWIDLDFRLWNKLLRESWQLAIISYFIIVYISIDQFMLGIMKTNVDVGIYSAAYKLLMIISVFSYVIMNSLFPRVSKKNVKISSYFSKLPYLFFIALLINTIVFFLAPYLYIYVFGSEFILAVSIIPILIFAGFFEFFVFWGYLFLVKFRKTTTILTLTGFSALTNILLNYYLIPLYNYYGAAIATVISYLFLSTSFYFVLRRLSWKLNE